MNVRENLEVGAHLCKDKGDIEEEPAEGLSALPHLGKTAAADLRHHLRG